MPRFAPKSCIRSLRLRLADERGVAAVEAALAFPFLLALMAGLFEFGSVFYNFELMQTGVRDAGRGIAGWAAIQRPDGDRTLVMLIGVERPYRGGLPAVSDLAAAKGLSDSALVLDASDARTLGFDDTVRTAQVAARRGSLMAETRGFASFIG